MTQPLRPLSCYLAIFQSIWANDNTCCYRVSCKDSLSEDWVLSTKISQIIIKQTWRFLWTRVWLAWRGLRQERRSDLICYGVRTAHREPLGKNKQRVYLCASKNTTSWLTTNRTAEELEAKWPPPGGRANHGTEPQCLATAVLPARRRNHWP